MSNSNSHCACTLRKKEKKKVLEDERLWWYGLTVIRYKRVNPFLVLMTSTDVFTRKQIPSARHPSKDIVLKF